MVRAKFSVCSLAHVIEVG